MTKSVAESLIEHKEFNAKDMAKRFTLEYFKQPKRGYGTNVVDVFAALKMSDFEKPFEPAKMQFSGTGSYGNGGAMRIAPIALFSYHFPEEKLIELAQSCAQITHSHRNGFNGAILQCLAVHQALKTNVSHQDKSFDAKTFLSNLISKISKIEIESSNDKLDNNDQTPFTNKLKKMMEVIESKDPHLSSSEAAVLFGNDISALKSVPSAIYSVIRGRNGLVNSNFEYESDNPFIRTLHFAISLGGDTDTIACMACSISGALYGEESIPNILQRHCEDIENVKKLADDLFQIQNKM